MTKYNNYNYGVLLEKARKLEAITAAKTVRDYCKSVKECETECVFYNSITGRCTFTKYNLYGEPKAPEDWEV